MSISAPEGVAAWSFSGPKRFVAVDADRSILEQREFVHHGPDLGREIHEAEDCSKRLQDESLATFKRAVCCEDDLGESALNLGTRLEVNTLVTGRRVNAL